MDVRDAVCGAHLLDAEPPGGAGKPSRDDARVDGGTAELRDEHVRVLLTHELVAELGVQAQRDLVRHRRGRDEDGLVLAEQRSCTSLQLVDGRILALLLVADDGGGDRCAHPLCRLRRGVGAKVDHRQEATLNAWI